MIIGAHLSVTLNGMAALVTQHVGGKQLYAVAGVEIARRTTIKRYVVFLPQPEQYT